MAARPEQSPECRGYVVSTAPETRGVVLKVLGGHPVGAAARRRPGKKCWELLFDRPSECPGCPAFHLARGGETSGILQDLEGPFTVVHALRGERSARVIAVSVPDALVVGLVRSKLHRLMCTARLTDRERLVLELLFLGRRTREIASALGIAQRTVKYHVANVLQKVSADSRLDLARMLLVPAETTPARAGKRAGK